MFARSLEVDHREIDALYADAVAALESGNSAAALEGVDILWARLAVHIRAEHLHLFPALNQSPGAAEVIRRLREDHNVFMNKLADSMKLLRTSGETSHTDMSEPLEIVRSLGPMLADHNRVEEETVYVDTGDLSGAEQDELTAAIEKELTNLPPRFSGGAK